VKRIIAILLCTLLLAGCQSEKPTYIPTGNGLYQDPTGSTEPPSVPNDTQQKMSLGYDPTESLNPYQTGSTTNRLLFNLIYQGLFGVDETYTVHPILCKNYRVSKDMKNYTFYLEAATFPDGQVLTAEDVVASLQCAKESLVYRSRLRDVSQIRVAEDGGVEVKLSIPYENLPILLDIPIVKADQTADEMPQGTGAYRLEQGQTRLWLLRRSNWWCQAKMPITAEQIPLTEATDAAALRDAFEFGQIRLVCADPGTESYVDFRCDYELWDCESGHFLYLACNENRKIFSNKALRTALTHAIDREMLVETYYKSYAISAYLPASPLSPYYDTALASQYGYDPQILAQAVAAAELESNAVTLLVNQADGRRVRVARAIAAMLKECGLVVTISALSGEQYTKALSDGNFDLHLGQTKLTANMDLTAFFATDGTLNYGGLSDVVCYSLCQEAMGNAGNYYSLHRTVMNSGMLCPILFRSYAIYVARGAVDDLTPARDNLLFYTLGKDMESCKLDNG